jgi:hypothetical protein
MANLKVIERCLSERKPGTWTEEHEPYLQALADYCDSVCEGYDSGTGDPIGGLAYRLASEVGWELNNLAPTKDPPCATPRPTSPEAATAGSAGTASKAPPHKLDRWPSGQKRFGPWLAERRNEMRIQMRDLADAIGIRASDLLDVETGRTHLTRRNQERAVAYLRERSA